MRWHAGCSSAADVRRAVSRVALAFSAASVLLTVTTGASPHSPAAPPAVRNDYADATFAGPLRTGLQAYFRRDFARAQHGFEAALHVIPENTLALSFLNACAVQNGHLDALIDTEEDALGQRPRDYLAHLRLGFSYLFATSGGRDRQLDAREELDAAVALKPDAPAAHDGLGIMREDARSKNRAKVEFLAALGGDPNDVLAREYLSLVYQADLQDPQRGLAYVIDIPNVVPEYADIYYHIASLLDDLGQSDAAIGYATRGLEADIGHVGEAGQHGYTLLAHIYLREHRLADARRVLHASIAADSDAAYAATLLRKVDRGDYNAARAVSPADVRP